jgi:hypothetical protein
MNLQQLETLGKAVAKQVRAQTGVHDLTLSTIAGVDGKPLGLCGTMTHEGREKTYTLNAQQVQPLLADSEHEASEFLQVYLHYQVRWFLFERHHPRDGEQGEGRR